ncbi:MAG: hypothetical protein ABIP53_09195, partial [Candidatus Limnocylindrales bacterium]
MAGKRNPFANQIASKEAEASGAPRMASDAIRNRDLRQASTESDDGHAGDTPPDVNADSDESQNLGSEFGLKGSSDFRSAADQVADDVPDNTADGEQADAPPANSRRDPEAERATFTDLFGNASQGDEQQEDVTTELLGGGRPDFNNRDKGGGNALLDAQIGFGDAALAQQAAHAKSPVNVADEPAGSVAAQVGVTTAAIGLTTAAIGAAAGSVAAVGIGAGVVVAGGGAVAAGATLLADDVTDGASSTAIINTLGLRGIAELANLAGEAVVAANEVASGAATPKEAFLQAADNFQKAQSSTGAASGGGKGGGTRDPGSPDDQPNTPEQRQFVEQMKQELGLRHIQGDVDPVDGDGATGGVAIGNPAEAKI